MENERVFNLRNGHVGVVRYRYGDRVAVTDTFTKTDTEWDGANTIPDWEHMTDECVGFMKCHMVEMYVTHPIPDHVHELACKLAYDGGEAFNETLLDVMHTWPQWDPVYIMVHMYLSDALNA